MSVYEEMYDEIIDLWNKLENTYYDTELSIDDISIRVGKICDLLEKYDEVRDENNN